MREDLASATDLITFERFEGSAAVEQGAMRGEQRVEVGRRRVR
jgi:hypothetical protein